MTKDNLLEKDDLILYRGVAGTHLVPVISVGRKYAIIQMPEGYKLLLLRKTDGNLAKLPKSEVTNIAVCTVIPRMSLN